MVNLQPLDAFLEKRRKQGEEEGRVFPNDTDVAIAGVRKLEAAMLVFDIANSSKYSADDFVENISPFLHTSFHIINDHDGIVDKYTGDGAMVSYCGTGMTSENACEYALETALDISKLLSILVKDYNFPEINLRIGIDYGPIKVERIGVRGKTHLIIVGHTANMAKKLEEIGSEVEFDQHSTIIVGYDTYHNLSKKSKEELCKRYYPKKSDYTTFLNRHRSIYTQRSPYEIYRYTGRYRK